jgi:plasmid maintenance system antidote protein VapI
MSDSSIQSPSKKSVQLADQLEKLRVTLLLDEKSWSDILDISIDEYSDIKKNRKDVSIVTLARIADYFHLTLENIMNNQIDYQMVAARHSGNVEILPERYQIGAGSRRRSSLNLLNATEEFLGWRARAMAMRHLHVTEAAFANPDEMINLRFNTDLCNYLDKNYGGSHLFYQLGAYSVIHNMNTPISAALAKARNVKELFLQFTQEIIPMHWERNFSYKILEFSDSGFRGEGIPNPEIAESLKVRNPGSAAVCQTKVGIVASVPGYLGLPFAHAEEVSCVHRGDEKCVYEVDFELATRNFKAMKERELVEMTAS